MSKDILVILIDKRNAEAVEVQKILTQYGCNIKTRLGLHDADDNKCSNEGLIILELCGDETEFEKLNTALNNVEHVKTKLINLKL